MKELLKEIKAELKKRCPAHIREAKVKYATKKQIDAFQKKSGIEFPQDLTDFWLSCDFEMTVDSKIYKTLGIGEAPAYFILDDLAMLIADWEQNSGESGYPMTAAFKAGDYYTFKKRGYKEGIITASVYDKKWFPLAIDSFGGSIVIDMNPGKKGTHGQLLYMLYPGEGKAGAYYTGFASLRGFLESYLSDLKEGRFEVEDDRVYPLIYS